MSEPSSERCPVCDGSDAQLRYRLTHFNVYVCVQCSLVYIWPLLTGHQVREMFTQLYARGEGSVPELKSYYDFTYEDSPSNPLVQLYESWLDAIERHVRPGRMLDIGCGTGLFLQVARWRGWEPFGVDDCAEATQYARDHFGLDVWDGQFTEFTGAGKTFDAITMWDIIEHDRKPVHLLATAQRVLAPGGVMGISTPNQRSILDVVAGAMYHATGGHLRKPLEKFYIEQHFLYFTPDTLARAIASAGLEVAEKKLESTDLRRLTLSPATRLVLRSLLAIGRLTGLENRLFFIARQAARSSAS